MAELSAEPVQDTTPLDESSDSELDDDIDIRDELEAALKSSSHVFSGSYYFKKRYSFTEAPNPLLHLSRGGIGTIGLPLSTPEARRIIGHADQAPFGKGERTLVDKDVRDTWELDAASISFRNPMWDSFIATVVQETCVALGVDFSASRPRAKLYKLLLYETGSHFLPHMDTEKVNGMFATLIILLPSEYTGGSAYLTHSKLSTNIDFSGDSLSSTCTLAWYTDVTHEIKPVLSGYRLALSYNLLHTTNTIRPSLSISQDIDILLQKILRTWHKNVDSGPEKIVYLLDHKYSQANLGESALKGSDVHLVSMLNHFIEGFDFCLGLATVECHLSGAADHDDYPGYGRGRYYDDDDEPSDIDFLEDVERDMSITNLVTMEGSALTSELEIGDDDGSLEAIPSNLREMVEDGETDEQEYEGYQGNYAGTLERWYRRTVLVIWPRDYHLQIVYGGNRTEYAMSALCRTTTTTSTPHESALARHLIGQPTREASEIVFRVAHKWNDIGLWKAAVEGYRNVEFLGSNEEFEVVKALEKWAPADVLPSVGYALQKDPSNTRRLGLLDEMGDRIVEQYSLETWVAQQREVILRSLKPLATGEGQLIISFAIKYGQFDALETIIVPQLRTSTEPRELLLLANSLFDEIHKHDGGDNNQAKVDTGKRIITDVLQNSIQRVNFLEVQKQQSSWTNSYLSYPYNLGRSHPKLEITDLHLQTCVKTHNEALIKRIVEKLVVPVPLDPASQKNLLLALVPVFNGMVAALPKGSLYGLDLFYRTVTPLFLEKMQRQELTDEDVTSLMEIGIVGGGIDFFDKAILPSIMAKPRTTSSYTRLIQQFQARRSELTATSSTASTSSVMSKLMNEIIHRLGQVPTKAEIIQVLELGHQMNELPRFLPVVQKLADKKLASVKPDYFKTFLPDLLPDLLAFLSRRRISLSTQPFGPLFKFIIFGWIQDVLGPKPINLPAQLASIKTIKCQCNLCAPFLKFLSSKTNGLEISVPKIGAPTVKHVVRNLDTSVARGLCTWSVVRTSPQGLTVTKNDDFFKALNWRSNQGQCISMLKAMSTDEAILRDIFGDEHYKTLLVRLDVPCVNASTQRSNVASSSTATRSAGGGTTNQESRPAKRRKIQANKDTIINLCSP